MMSGSEGGSCVCSQIWGTGLSGGARAVVMLNRHFDEDPMFDNSSITLHWHHLGWEPDMPVRRKLSSKHSLYRSLVHSSIHTSQAP